MPDRWPRAKEMPRFPTRCLVVPARCVKSMVPPIVTKDAWDPCLSEVLPCLEALDVRCCSAEACGALTVDCPWPTRVWITLRE